MSTATGPVLMFQHCLDELKGWPDEAALDFDAFLAPPGAGGVNVDPVYGGTCVHVNAGGEFVLGVGPADMGIFLLQGSHELDVNNFGGNQWYPIAPTGKMSGLVCTGAYELETTEFYYGPPTGTPPAPPTTPALGMYTPGMQLTSPTEAMITGTDLTAAGKLFATMAWPGGAGGPVMGSTGPVCAVVSRANHINHHRVPVLSFWPVYVPKH
jgi:hypothetical protein